jgi:alcohol dehydrogenase class IV
MQAGGSAAFYEEWLRICLLNPSGYFAAEKDWKPFMPRKIEMKNFSYQHPTEIIFGIGRFAELGSIVTRFGRRCLLVSYPKTDALTDRYAEASELLRDAAIEFEHFDDVIPNPTIEIVSQGAKIARAFAADMVLGIGGGSSLDTAKAIAVEATHEGSCWDYLFFSWESAIPQFAKLARVLDPTIHEASDEKAAQFSPELFAKFLARAELNYSLKQLDVPEEELPALVNQSMVLPDYTRNPKIPTAEEMLSIITQSF